MANEVNMTKFFPIDSETLFNYFVQPNLIEQWAYPEGMTLKIPEFDAKVNGRYRYEHTGKDGQYLCTGHIKELVPGKKLIQFDEEIKGPDGKTLYQNLESGVEFFSKPGGTEIRLYQRGFEDEEGAVECEQGWQQSLDHLSDIVGKEAGFQRGVDESEQWPDVRG
ncbi:SRPBCC family protein [Peredibacter starrii]|uniref:SRPBCC family protein n=1 Tax=Peredibacter starrii TaxID=28202 RepID=A0AAX4HM64_9BACT|nr:SRPBCC family protein [Peredibacter starrii]WPU64311.1 SRPBCC family protein [Peredibacter starrii]